VDGRGNVLRSSRRLSDCLSCVESRRTTGIDRTAGGPLAAARGIGHTHTRSPDYPPPRRPRAPLPSNLRRRPCRAYNVDPVTGKNVGRRGGWRRAYSRSWPVVVELCTVGRVRVARTAGPQRVASSLRGSSRGRASGRRQITAGLLSVLVALRNLTS